MNKNRFNAMQDKQINDRKMYLQQKLKNLEESIINLDWRIEKEKMSSETLYQDNSNLCYDGSGRTFGMDFSSWSDSCKAHDVGLRANDGHYSSQLEDITRTPTEASDQSSFLSLSSPSTLNASGDSRLNYALTQPKLFFSWDTNQADFDNRWIHKKITRVLEESGRTLDVDKLTKSLTAEVPEEPLVHSYEKKLKRVRAKCLKDLRAFEDTAQLKENVEEQGSDEEETSSLQEDIIIECFKEPDLTNYEDLPFPVVFQELQNLEGMLKTVKRVHSNVLPYEIDKK